MKNKNHDIIDRLIKEEYQLIKEVNVCSKRFNRLTEGVKLSNGKEYSIFFENILKETNILKSEGYSDEVIEESISSMIQNFMSNMSAPFMSEFKERLVRWVLNLFNVKGKFADFLSVTLGNVNISDVPKLFTNCRYLTNIIADGAFEYGIKYIQDSLSSDDDAGFFSDMFRQTVSEMFRDGELVQSFQDKLIKIICPRLNKVNNSMAQKLG